MAANPGSVRSESLHFTAAQGIKIDTTTGALHAHAEAGVWAANVEIPVGAVLLDVVVYAKTLWDAGTSATLIVGDTTDPNGWYAAVDLKATDLTAGQSLCLARVGGKSGTDISEGSSSHLLNVMQAAAATAPYGKVVSAEITTVGVTTTGDTTVCFVYAYPSPVPAAFTAT